MGAFTSRHESYLILICLVIALVRSEARSQTEVPSCTLSIPLQGAITPAAVDFFDRAVAEAKGENCVSLLVRINTPGGDLVSARRLVEKILAAPIPILCLVSPEGGHAGSAGALILLGCHVSGALPATNLGAATPIGAQGQSISKDLREKIIQDTVSWAKGLAKLRNRNGDFAERIVRDAAALDANEAAEKKAIDVLSVDVPKFLEFAEGRKVTMEGGVEAVVRVGALTEKKPDLRMHVLTFITDPQLAYLVFMISLGLLYFEITHPGTILPGVAGSIGLLTSFIAFQYLDVWWGGAGLIALGLAMLLLEAFVPSFGALGIGGIVALGAGSLLLYEPASPGGGVGLTLIATTTVLLGGAMFALGLFAFHTRRRTKPKDLTSSIGEILKVDSPSLRRGLVRVEGELWQFRSDADVHPGEVVVVIDRENLVLNVRKQN